MGSILIFDGRPAHGASHAILEPIVETSRVKDVATYIDFSQDLLVFDLQLANAARRLGFGTVVPRHQESGVAIHIS